MPQTTATAPKSTFDRDPRLDPRIKAYFAGMKGGGEKPNVASREELLAQEHSPVALAGMARQKALFDSMDSEEVAPSTGVTCERRDADLFARRQCHQDSVYTAR